MKFEFTQQQVSHLVEFLHRTDLKGREVYSFTEILNILHNPIKEDLFNNEQVGQ